MKWLVTVAMGLVACGGSLSTPDVLQVPDAESGSTTDAPTPREADSGHDAEALTCLDEAVPVSDDCKVGNPCSSCTTGREYFCRTGAPRTYGRTPLRCARLEDVGGGPHFCCEPACVRRSAVDGACQGVSQTQAYECPNDGAGGSLVGPPSGSCVSVSPDISTSHPRLFCCD